MNLSCDGWVLNGLLARKKALIDSHLILTSDLEFGSCPRSNPYDSPSTRTNFVFVSSLWISLA